MKEAPTPARRKTGRPLSFDPEAALAPALLLFWRHGYEATSLADLTRAMGVTPPSVYAAYGDKKGLFRAVVRRYLEQPISPVAAIAQASTAEAAARGLIEGAVVAFTGRNTPAGCLLASSAIAVSPGSEDLKRELAAIRRDIETALRKKIEAEIPTGARRGKIDAGALAAFTMTVVQGLSTLARDGASRSKLRKVASLAMANWPSGMSQEKNSRSW